MYYHGDTESTEVEPDVFSSVPSAPPLCTLPSRFESPLILIAIWTAKSSFVFA